MIRLHSVRSSLLTIGGAFFFFLRREELLIKRKVPSDGIGEIKALFLKTKIMAYIKAKTICQSCLNNNDVAT
jgi:hypothetical protein